MLLLGVSPQQFCHQNLFCSSVGSLVCQMDDLLQVHFSVYLKQFATSASWLWTVQGETTWSALICGYWNDSVCCAVCSYSLRSYNLMALYKYAYYYYYYYKWSHCLVLVVVVVLVNDIVSDVCQMWWKRQVSSDVCIAEAEIDSWQDDSVCQHHWPMLQVTNCILRYLYGVYESLYYTLYVQVLCFVYAKI